MPACEYACACTYACLCRYSQKKSHLEIMKTMLAITLTRKRTTPITARETARDTNSNSYDPKLENGNNCHILIHHRCSIVIKKISSTDVGMLYRIMGIKPGSLGEITYFSSNWSEETGDLFQFQLVRGDCWFVSETITHLRHQWLRLRSYTYALDIT